MNRTLRAVLIPVIGVVLAIFTLLEVNLALVEPQARLAVFALLGIVLCFLIYPVAPRWKDVVWLRTLDLVWASITVGVFGYVIVQSDPHFEAYWAKGMSLGNRAGIETKLDILIGWIGLVIVIEATRRSIGWALPLLALLFVAHAYFGEVLPDWMLPHAQMKASDIVAKTFLQSLGVFGPALNVMFTYVYLFVIFGGFLEVTGATQFIVDFAERVFARSPGGPAKVSVLGSGLMGSLSGSAVANAVTTGTFTIPMMRNAGFQSHVAGGITAAAASGGALVPPVMGAGAYMMLEIVEPPVTFLEVASAALIPAVLYYFSIFMIVHFYSRRVGVVRGEEEVTQKTIPQLLLQFEGFVFFGALLSLIGFLVVGYSPFRAVTLSLGVIIALAVLRFLADAAAGRRQLNLPVLHTAGKTTLDALTKSARNGVSLVSASACVGIIIAVVQTTGIAGDFNLAIKDVVEQSLLLALIGIMACSLVLGMGVPSVVCYLLMATLMGGLLKELGVIPLAAHLFIFYFGMMSMVTPPVALAAFASASIANANVMRTGVSAFLFSLVGFTLPFMFVYRPELLLLSNKPKVENAQVIERDGQMTRLEARLLKIDEPLNNAVLECTDQSAGEVQTVTTSPTGEFQLPPEVTTWRLVLVTDQTGESQASVSETDSASKDPVRLTLGDLTFDPQAVESEDGGADPRVRFVDRRLPALQIVSGTVAAALGIVALAAGIAGYLRGPLPLVLRLASFAAAALLLYPGAGFTVGGVRVGLTDLIGVAVLVGVVLVNRAAPAPTAAAPGEHNTQS